ncbi:MAG: CpaF family protein [Gemmataceae bacterium]|nr:CpaF family protein [Gemmataceae bacterium]MDW8264879.1 CpaF family protein [Gemmataceae bacterium]
MDPQSSHRPPEPPAPSVLSKEGSQPGIRDTPLIASGKAYDEIKERLHAKLVATVKPEEVAKLSEEERRREIRSVAERLIETECPLANLKQRNQLLQDLLDEVLGLGPLEKLLRDPSISDILVNGPYEVWIERRGQLEETPIRFRDTSHLLEIIYRIVSRVGRRVDESSPMVDARLPDGSRVNAIVPPVSLRGPALSIRRFGTNPLHMKDLIHLKSLSPQMAQLLEGVVKARLNVVISGGTGSGKTTLLNALSSFIPANERIITIEDAAELQLQQRHVVQLEARPPNVEGKGEITTRDLVRNALRMRPNRIIVGECRGAEVLDMLQAMNTGHEGSMSTLHANSPRDALARLELMMLLSGIDIPVKAMRQQIASALNVIVQIDRLPGGPRRVTSISEIVGMEQDVVIAQEIFIFRQLGIDHHGKAFGQFEATGVRPKFMERLAAASIELPPHLFHEGVQLRA